MLGWLTGRAWHATYAGVSCPFGPRPIGYNENPRTLMEWSAVADMDMEGKQAEMAYVFVAGESPERVHDHVTHGVEGSRAGRMEDEWNEWEDCADRPDGGAHDRYPHVDERATIDG